MKLQNGMIVTNRSACIGLVSDGHVIWDNSTENPVSQYDWELRFIPYDPSEDLDYSGMDIMEVYRPQRFALTYFLNHIDSFTPSDCIWERDSLEYYLAQLAP